MKAFAELNREQIRSLAKDALVVVPLGATEQHGPHLPTGTDLFSVESIANDAARLASDVIPVIITPALPFGCSDHHFVFGGTISLGTETYYRVLKNILESLVTDGFRRIFLVNGHGGNHDLMQIAARDVALNHPVRIGAGSYWTIAWRAFVDADAHLGRRLPGHAGDFETSVMMSLRPELIAESLPRRDGVGDSDPRAFEAAWRTEQHGFWKEIDGYTDSPANATAEKGVRFRSIAARAVAEALIAFYGS